MIRVAITFDGAWQYTINSGNNKLLESMLYRHRDNVRAAVRKLQAAATGYDPASLDAILSELALACAVALDADATRYKHEQAQKPARPPARNRSTRAESAPPSPQFASTEGQDAAKWGAPAPAAAPESKGSQWLAPAAPKEPWS